MDGLIFMEMAVTRAGTSSALLWYKSPEHTNLFPPSTAHKPDSAPASATAPTKGIRHIHTLLYALNQCFQNAFAVGPHYTLDNKIIH